MIYFVWDEYGIMTSKSSSQRVLKKRKWSKKTVHIALWNKTRLFSFSQTDWLVGSKARCRKRWSAPRCLDWDSRWVYCRTTDVSWWISGKRKDFRSEIWLGSNWSHSSSLREHSTYTTLVNTARVHCWRFPDMGDYAGRLWQGNFQRIRTLSSPPVLQPVSRPSLSSNHG